MSEIVPDATFASRGRIIHQHFHQLVSSGRPDADIAAAWRNEYTRFSLWADNLGVHHHGHSSLDYRVREAEALKEFISTLLDRLMQCIDEALTERGGQSPVSPSSEDSDESEEILDEYDDETSGESNLRAAIDIIDRLFRLAIKIRSPSARLVASKSTAFSQVDPESGIDLVQIWGQYDLAHVEEMFWSHRARDVVNGKDLPMEDRDRMHRPRSLTDEDEALIKKLAYANTRRRQQFAYWRQHRNKVSAATTRNLRNYMIQPVGGNRKEQAYGAIDPLLAEMTLAPSTTAFSRPTTATFLEVGKLKNFDSAESTTSSRTTAPQADSTSDEHVDVPAIPPSLAKDKFFTCPYCFTICSQSTAQPKQWREHVLRDLRPYVCTYSDCRSGNQLYDNWKEWKSHELENHNRIWRCIEHPERKFWEARACRDHLEHDHDATYGVEDLDALVNAGATTADFLQRPCPFCYRTFHDASSIQSHLAIHLQRVALFALPNSTGLEEEDSAGQPASSNAEAGGSSDVVSPLSSLTFSIHSQDSSLYEVRRTTGESEADVPEQQDKNPLERFLAQESSQASPPDEHPASLQQLNDPTVDSVNEPQGWMKFLRDREVVDFSSLGVDLDLLNALPEGTREQVLERAVVEQESRLTESGGIPPIVDSGRYPDNTGSSWNKGKWRLATDRERDTLSGWGIDIDHLGIHPDLLFALPQSVRDQVMEQATTVQKSRQVGSEGRPTTPISSEEDINERAQRIRDRGNELTSLRAAETTVGTNLKGQTTNEVPLPSSSSPYPWSVIEPPPHTPFPRYGAAVNSVATRAGKIFIHGGLCNTAETMGDLWLYDINESIKVSQLASDGSDPHGPSRRVGHAAVLMDNSFIIWGGDTRVNESDELDATMYLLNIDTQLWSKVYIDPTQILGGRYGHTLTWLGTGVYIFGGQLDQSFSNDLFLLDRLAAADNHMQILRCPIAISPGETTSSKPPGRTNHSMVAFDGKLILFGGTDGIAWYNDVWEYDPTSSLWKAVDAVGYIPKPREGHAAAIVGPVMYVHGGRDVGGADLGELAAFHITKRRWYTFRNMGPGPSPRSGHSMTAHSNGLIFVLGGEPSSPRTNDQSAELQRIYVLDTGKIRFPND